LSQISELSFRVRVTLCVLYGTGIGLSFAACVYAWVHGFQLGVNLGIVLESLTLWYVWRRM
jgi:hypothetical protein